MSEKNKAEVEEKEPSSRLVYSDEIELQIRLLKETGWSDYDILKKLLGNVGGYDRYRVIEKYAAYLGLSVNDALQLARRKGLIPVARRAPKKT